MRSTVACLTVLFVAGFLSGGPRDSRSGEHRAAERIETGAVDSTGDGVSSPTPDLRIGFRWLSAPAHPSQRRAASASGARAR